MTKFQQAALVGFGATVIVFLAFAFGQWSVNPGNWEDGTRALCAAMMIFSGFFAFGARMTAPN